MRRRVWVILLLAGLLGCASGGDGSSANEAGVGDGGVLDGGANGPDGAVSGDGQACSLAGFFNGACCERADGSQGLCTAAGCTVDAPATASEPIEGEFSTLCLALCSEQCIVGEQLGPCCMLNAGGVGICQGAECLGPDGAEANDVCATLDALDPSVGCGDRVPGAQLDDPCGSDAQCETGHCLRDDPEAVPERPEGPYCSALCPDNAECPRWFACVGDQCVRSGRLGQGCQDSGQCESGLCVRTAEGPFCTRMCDDRTACPESWACDIANGVCVPPVPE